MSSLFIEEVEVENLRGYHYASLSLGRPRTLIVGPNNAGKTSLLKLMNWALNEFECDATEGLCGISDEEKKFLLAARDARHRARRFTLYIRMYDRRSWRKFSCDENGIATLRFNLRITPKIGVYVSLGPPSRGESAENNLSAIELLKRIREEVHFIHIPSFRDARSDSFDQTLRGTLKTRIEKLALHASASGTPREHRDVAGSLRKLEEVVLGLANPLWDEVKSKLPPGMTRNGKLDLECTQADLLTFLESKLSLKVSTGEHDSLTVSLPELGSGLQSLLDLAFQESESPQQLRTIVAIEEPEAFLHPSAQRTVIGRLLLNGNSHRQVIVTTHSPIVIEEAKYGDIVICRDQSFYEPKNLQEESRENINTALLSGFGAEMMFATSILFVEGEGDRQFFEQLRRRIAKHDTTGAIDNCFVLPVGGKTRFSPWMKLLNSYGSRDDRPIKWLAACDADASTEIRDAFRQAGIVMQQEMLRLLGAVTTAKNNGDANQWRIAAREANVMAHRTSTQFQLMELDLEGAALSNASDAFVSDVARTAGWNDEVTKDVLLQRLGAKGYNNNGEGNKQPWLRGYMGNKLPQSEVSEGVLQCLTRWFSLSVGAGRTEGIIREWRNAQI